MMNTEPAMLAWITYLVASVLVILFGWHITRNWRPVILARIVRVWVAVLFLVPAYVEPGSSVLAPAWVVTGFALAGEGAVAASQGYIPLLSAMLIGAGVIIVGALAQRPASRADGMASREERA